MPMWQALPHPLDSGVQLQLPLLTSLLRLPTQPLYHPSRIQVAHRPRRQLLGNASRHLAVTQSARKYLMEVSTRQVKPSEQGPHQTQLCQGAVLLHRARPYRGVLGSRRPQPSSEPARKAALGGRRRIEQVLRPQVISSRRRTNG